MTLYNLVMFIHALSIVALFLELVYVTTQKPSTMQNHIIELLITTLLMFVGYFLELKSTSLDMAFMGTVISYLGKPFILIYGFLIICDFYNVDLPKTTIYLMNALCGFISLSVVTTRSTHMYYATVDFNPLSKYEKLVLTRGPIYFVYLASIVVFFVASITVIVKELKRNKSKENKAYAFYFAMMLICSFLGYVVYISGLSKEYDATVFGLVGGIACLSVLFFRYKIFDVLTLAKDKSLENSPTGLVIIDENSEVSYANKLGRYILENIISATELKELKEENPLIKDNNTIYSIEKSVIDVHGKAASISFEFSDVTDSIKYQETLESEVKQRTDRIESIQRKVVNSFASVVEARSLETGEHIVRTSEYVRITIESLLEMGLYTDILTPDYIKCLVDVAPLHDIGKISISDSILLKPGRLDEKEYKQMKKHAELGSKVIETTMKGVENDYYVNMAMEVANYHHERWDGTGYPKKLKGEQIPLCARIMAIADTYDALVAKRCYKKAFTKKQAIAILKEESGTHFEPIIVEAFLKAIEKK